MEDGYEYGGGGPEYMADGLISGGADMLCFWVYSELSLLIFSISR